MPIIAAIDLETACATVGCPHEGTSGKCDHSLSPWHGRITLLACSLSNGAAPKTFRKPQELVAYLAQTETLSRDGELFITGHNLKFDLLWLLVHAKEAGQWVKERWAFDTMLMFHVSTNKIPAGWVESYNNNRPSAHHRKAGQHSLKTLAPYFLGVEPYWEAEQHDDVDYVIKDVTYTRMLTEYALEHHTEQELTFVRDRLMPWANMVLEAECEGLRLDLDALTLHEEELRQHVTTLEQKLDDVWSDAHEAWRERKRGEVNAKYDAQREGPAREARRAAALAKCSELKLEYSSPAQMAWLLRDHYGYDINSLEGEESTGREVLERLADESARGVKTYLEWRKAKKILTAFIPTFKELVDKEGRIHPTYNITGARTGRLSSERPNAQQVPSSLKQFFSPGSGRVLIGYDMAAIEAKLIGLFSEDQTLCELLQTGESIHNLNTKVFFNLPEGTHLTDVPRLYGKERKVTKNVGFALFYHAGANRIRVTFAQGGYLLTPSECKQIHCRFLDTYKEAMSFAKELVKAAELGEVFTNLLGRPIKIQDPNDAYMTAFNTLVQSSASDLNMDRALAALNRLRAEGIDARPHLFVHDYVGLSVPSEDADRANSIMAEELVNFKLTNKHGEIKLQVEGGVSETWE
jgi:DNA polymerase I-like protein with 3'-5' exonuclease and polymerase domains